MMITMYILYHKHNIYEFLYLIYDNSDGACDGHSHKTGGRVATALFYCKTADKGGSTTFTKSNVYIKPKNRTVAFFSYKGPDGSKGLEKLISSSANLMDPLQLTEHSACPVRKGEKWATAIWFRVGKLMY